MATYIPTQAMADNAAMALKVREGKPDSQKGMTLIGLGRARDIAARRPMSEDTVRRVKSFLERHEVDKQGATWSDKGKGWQAFHGWGGDQAYTWASNIVAQLDRESKRYITIPYTDSTDDTAYRKYLYS
jgi:hypothetical protein